MTPRSPFRDLLGQQTYIVRLAEFGLSIIEALEAGAINVTSIARRAEAHGLGITEKGKFQAISPDDALAEGDKALRNASREFFSKPQTPESLAKFNAVCLTVFGKPAD